MQGTLTDFLKLVAAKPELAADLVGVARKHGFEFARDELAETELDAVTGGGILDSVSGGPVMADPTGQSPMFMAFKDTEQALLEFASEIDSSSTKKSIS